MAGAEEAAPGTSAARYTRGPSDSAADKLHNTRAVLADFREHGHPVWGRITGGREGTVWHYRRLVEVFREAGPSLLVDELRRVVSELEHLAGVV